MSDFEGWAILELMGHRRLAGKVSEVTIAGTPFIRIDVMRLESEATQFYSGAAVYCITPTSEETARQVAELSAVAPVQRWELPSKEPELSNVPPDPWLGD